MPLTARHAASQPVDQKDARSCRVEGVGLPVFGLGQSSCSNWRLASRTYSRSRPLMGRAERGAQYNGDVLRMGRTELHAGDADRVAAPTQADARINVASVRVDRFGRQRSASAVWLPPKSADEMPQAPPPGPGYLRVTSAAQPRPPGCFHSAACFFAIGRLGHRLRAACRLAPTARPSSG